MDELAANKEYSREYSQYLSWLTPEHLGLAPRPMNSSLYSRQLLEFLDILVKLPINTCVTTIFQALTLYICHLLNDNRYNQSFRDTLSKPDPLLAKFEWALKSTVKQRKYQRLKAFHGPKEAPALPARIADAACQLSFDDALDFMGELAGAWILSYPLDAIRKYEDVLTPMDWATEEEDCIFTLLRHFDIEMEEWRK